MPGLATWVIPSEHQFWLFSLPSSLAITRAHCRFLMSTSFAFVFFFAGQNGERILYSSRLSDSKCSRGTLSCSSIYTWFTEVRPLSRTDTFYYRFPLRYLMFMFYVFDAQVRHGGICLSPEFTPREQITWLPLAMVCMNTNHIHSPNSRLVTCYSWNRYDYGGAITESRELTPKYAELKLQGLFLRSVPEFYKTNVVGNSTDGTVTIIDMAPRQTEGRKIKIEGDKSKTVFATKLKNPDTQASFYVVRQTNSSSM